MNTLPGSRHDFNHNLRILNIHRRDPQNPGDCQSSPLHYFSFSKDQTVVDVNDITASSDLSAYDAIIVGGGGLMQGDFLPMLSLIPESIRSKVVVWGAGANIHYFARTIQFKRTQWNELAEIVSGWFLKRRIVNARQQQTTATACEKWLRSCGLVGIRDFGTEYKWVPCVSCMDPLLDNYRNNKPIYRLVAIDHPDFCRIVLPGVPRLSNLGAKMDTVLEFISSGEILLSASYHAAYWGILLGKKVIVVPWSEKFMHFKQDIPFCNKYRDLKQCLEKARNYPEALADCRNNNLAFAREVSHYLGLDGSSTQLVQKTRGSEKPMLAHAKRVGQSQRA